MSGIFVYAAAAFARGSAVQGDLILVEWLELLKEFLDGKREVCIHIRRESEGLRVGIGLSRGGEEIGPRDGQGDLAPQMGEGEKRSAEPPGEEGSFPAPFEQVPGDSDRESEPIQEDVAPPAPKGGLWRLEKLGVVASTKKKLVPCTERITLPRRLLLNRWRKALAKRRRFERPWRWSGKAWSSSVPG